MRRLGLLFAGLLPLLAPQVARANEMRAMTINGYQLIDGEYWNWIGMDPFHYPADVEWGFYADGVTDAARDCAAQGYRQLTDLFSVNSADLQEVTRLGGTPRFYLWIDDYSAAAPGRPERPAQLWHLNQNLTANDSDYSDGSWQWEVILSQTGVCILPNLNQAFLALEDAAKVLSH